MPGSLVNPTTSSEIEDYDWLVAIKEAQLNMQRLAITPEEEKKVSSLNDSIEHATAEIEVLEKVSQLQKRFRKYQKHHFAETWASRWVASPIAYLFPQERREEWLGDLYEVNAEMLRKDYPRFVVNIINLGKVTVLVLSAMKIKLSDFLSIASTKKP